MSHVFSNQFDNCTIIADQLTQASLATIVKTLLYKLQHLTSDSFANEVAQTALQGTPSEFKKKLSVLPHSVAQKIEERIVALSVTVMELSGIRNDQSENAPLSYEFAQDVVETFCVAVIRIFDLFFPGRLGQVRLTKLCKSIFRPSQTLLGKELSALNLGTVDTNDIAAFKDSLKALNELLCRLQFDDAHTIFCCDLDAEPEEVGNSLEFNLSEEVILIADRYQRTLLHYIETQNPN